MKMALEKIDIGQSGYGVGPYTIEDITNNAVILLRNGMNKKVALLNLGVDDDSRQTVPEFVTKYLAQFTLEEDVKPTSIEAIIVGGDFREHRGTDEGYIIFVDHTLARRSAEEALIISGVRPKYIPADNNPDIDRRMTKRLSVNSNADFEVKGELIGLNQHLAHKSITDYDMTLGKYHDG